MNVTYTNKCLTRAPLLQVYERVKNIYKTAANAFSSARVATENEKTEKNEFEIDLELENEFELELENEHEFEIEFSLSSSKLDRNSNRILAKLDSSSSSIELVLEIES